MGVMQANRPAVHMDGGVDRRGVFGDFAGGVVAVNMQPGIRIQKEPRERIGFGENGRL